MSEQLGGTLSHIQIWLHFQNPYRKVIAEEGSVSSTTAEEEDEEPDHKMMNGHNKKQANGTRSKSAPRHGKGLKDYTQLTHDISGFIQIELIFLEGFPVAHSCFLVDANVPTPTGLPPVWAEIGYIKNPLIYNLKFPKILTSDFSDDSSEFFFLNRR